MRHDVETHMRVGNDERNMHVALLLRVRAEMAFGVLVVVRNRSVRLALLLSLTMVCLSLIQYQGPPPRADYETTVFLVAGTLAAVSGSRLLAPGGAIAASRQVAAPIWLVPFGRLTGSVAVIVPVVAVAAFSLNTADVDFLRMVFTSAVYAAAVGAGALAIAPAVGGSTAALIGLLVVCVGIISPTGLISFCERWPVLQRTLGAVWHLLPLQWRASRFVDDLTWVDPLMLICWTVFALALAGWAAIPVHPGHNWFGGRRWQP